MQEHEPITSITDNTNGSESKSGVQRLAIVFIVVASFGLLICTSLLVQVLITHQPAFVLPINSLFKSARIELLGYSSFLIYMAGMLTLFIAANISRFVDVMSKRIGYLSVIIGTVLTFCSFWLSYTSYKLEKEWWAYFAGMAWGTIFIAMNFYYLADAKQKYYRNILQIIILILIFMAFGLTSLIQSN